MRTLFLLALLLAVLEPVAANPAVAQEKLPLTVDELIAACTSSEDSDPARAIALADDILSRSEAISPLQKAGAIGCRGWSRINAGKRDDAFRDAHALFLLVQPLPPSADRVRLIRRAGGILHRGDDRVGAIDYYARAVTDAEALGLEAERIPLLVNLGVLHSEFEEHERARINYEQALALMARLNDFRHEAPVRFNLGLNYSGQFRYVEAVTNLQRALDLIKAQPSPHPGQLFTVQLALAKALLSAGDSAASQALIDMLRSDEAVLDENMKTQLSIQEAEQFAANGMPQRALTMIDSLLQLPSPTINDIQRWQLLKLRSRTLENLGRFQEAAQTLREVNTQREAHLRHQNHEHLAALDAHMRDREQRFELERLQSEAALRSQELNTIRRLQWTGLAIVSFLAVLGVMIMLWQRRMNRRLLEASHTDPLTLLRNRRSMSLVLRDLSLASQQQTALLLLDLDHFKQINDQHGHDVGDEVLVEYARRLREHAGKSASVARWGGEEFLIAVPAADAKAAQAIAESLQRLLALPMETRKGLLSAEASVGIANLPLSGILSPTAWHHSLQLADSALYQAKRLGRSAWVSYWIEQPIADWPPERLGRDPQLARSLGVIHPDASRALRDPVVAMVG